MADTPPSAPDDNSRDDAGRLEAALTRIARHRAPDASPAFPPTLAARLDTLIADIRAVLGGAAPD